MLIAYGIEFAMHIYFIYLQIEENGALPRGAASAFGERFFVRKKSFFRRNTLCISRGNGAFSAEKIRRRPQTNRVVLPQTEGVLLGQR